MKPGKVSLPVGENRVVRNQKKPLPPQNAVRRRLAKGQGKGRGKGAKFTLY
jgi:hypothetical protein